MTEETKKKRPDLGIAVPVTNKKTPQSYDLSGNIVVEGKKYKFGAYRSTASGNGKMPKLYLLQKFRSSLLRKFD